MTTQEEQDADRAAHDARRREAEANAVEQEPWPGACETDR